MRKRKKHSKYVSLVSIALALIPTLILLYFLVRPQVCGYTKDGFEIGCSCIGLKRIISDEKGIVSAKGKITYCHGFAQTRVCFKQFENKNIAKPYLCSEYPYEVSILVQASQFSLPLYPDSKFSYDAQLSSGDRVVLETQEEVACPELRVQGFVEKISLGGAPASYQDLHLYAVDFQCLE